MTKKSILTAVVSLALVAAVSIGGTLAYITATSNEEVNTLTIGDIEIELTEPEFEDGSKLLPGVAIVKDPTLTVASGSEKAYLKVEAVVPAALYALLDPTSLAANTGWFLESAAANTDGDYVYSFYYGSAANALTVVDAGAADVTTTAAFTEVMIRATADEAAYKALTTNDLKIAVTGYAIQADGNALTAPWSL